MKNPSQKVIAQLEDQIVTTLKAFETAIVAGTVPSYTLEDVEKDFVKIFTDDMLTLETGIRGRRTVEKRAKEIISLYIEAFVKDAQNRPLKEVVEVADKDLINPVISK